MHTGNVIDLVCREEKIIAEIKNKFNTISGGKLSELYYSLDRLIMPQNSIYKNYTAYYVPVIPKKPARYNKAFVPSDKEKKVKCPVNEKIRETDGASFYDMVTGKANSLEELFQVLPSVITGITGKKIHDKEKLIVFFKMAYG